MRRAHQPLLLEPVGARPFPELLSGLGLDPKAPDWPDRFGELLRCQPQGEAPPGIRQDPRGGQAQGVPAGERGGLLGAQGGRAWREVREVFASLGYRLFWRVLDAADYGVPQHRECLFLVELREGEFRFPRPTHGPDSPGAVPYRTPREALQGVEDPKPPPPRGAYAHLLAEVPPGLNYAFFTEEMGHPQPIFAWRSKFSDFLYKAHPDLPVRTLKAHGGAYTGPFHWEGRPFSVGELKHLHTFPDAYALPDSLALARQQVGNAVPPQLARLLALAVAEQVFGLPLPFPLAYLGHGEELGFAKRKRLLTAFYRRQAASAQLREGERGEGILRLQAGVKGYRFLPEGGPSRRRCASRVPACPSG